MAGPHRITDPARQLRKTSGTARDARRASLPQPQDPEVDSHDPRPEIRLSRNDSRTSAGLPMCSGARPGTRRNSYERPKRGIWTAEGAQRGESGGDNHRGSDARRNTRARAWEPMGSGFGLQGSANGGTGKNGAGMGSGGTSAQRRRARAWREGNRSPAWCWDMSTSMV